jgi:ABC-type multidrug transport system permease subunit
LRSAQSKSQQNPAGNFHPSPSSGSRANDPVHYFSEQPHQLLVVAAIAIVGGLITLMFYRLSPHWRRRAKLITLGFTAGLFTYGGCCFSYLLAKFPYSLNWAMPHHLLYLLMAIALGMIVVAGLLWFEFYQAVKKRDL